MTRTPKQHSLKGAILSGASQSGGQEQRVWSIVPECAGDGKRPLAWLLYWGSLLLQHLLQTAAERSATSHTKTSMQYWVVLCSRYTGQGCGLR